MSFENKAQMIANDVEMQNPHFNIDQVAAAVFTEMFGTWFNSETDRRNMRMIRAAIGAI